MTYVGPHKYCAGCCDKQPFSERGTPFCATCLEVWRSVQRWKRTGKL